MVVHDHDVTEFQARDTCRERERERQRERERDREIDR